MMNEPTKKITVPEGSSLAKLLTDVGSRPILLEKNGELYRLERMENKEKTLSSDEVARSRDAILKAVGRAWTPRRLKHISLIGGTLPIVRKSYSSSPTTRVITLMNANITSTDDLRN